MDSNGHMELFSAALQTRLSGAGSTSATDRPVEPVASSGMAGDDHLLSPVHPA